MSVTRMEDGTIRKSLSSRLQNCLLTILELEDTLKYSHLGPVLKDEFVTLKEVMRRLETVDVEEDDVCRIECATGRFLAELKETFDATAPAELPTTRLIQ